MKLGHTIVHVPSVSDALAFYEMNLGGNFVPVSATATPPGIELAFVTEDVPSAYAKVIAAGAMPLHPPAQKPWGQVVAYVRSLEGRLIELCSLVTG